MYILIGTFPPPLGGVSVFCGRRYQQLKSKGDSVRFVNVSSRFKSLILLFYYSVRYRFSDVTYELNSSNIIILLLIWVLGISKKTVFIDHNSSRRVLSNRFHTVVLNLLSVKFRGIKVVNCDLKGNYRSDVAYKVSVLSPFLPPSKLELEISTRQLTPLLNNVINSPERRVILTSAWRPVDTANEPDLYGIVDSLHIYQQLIETYPSYVFVLMIGEMDDSALSNQVKLISEQLNRYNNFYFVTGGLSQLALLPKTKVLLRLTKTDGDSVSINEALYFGSSVVCSNVVTRPSAAVTVPLNDNAVLMATIRKILDSE